MLKLEQIRIVESNTLIVEVLEPIVYTKVGTVMKTDEKILKEKDNAPYILAKVLKVGETLIDTTQNQLQLSPKYSKGDTIMITKSSLIPITFPVKGYDSPKIATINTYSITAVIEEDNSYEEDLASV